MSEARLDRQAAGQFALVGELSFASVPGLVALGTSLFDDVNEARLDLSQVERSDSAGLALLVSWVMMARQQGKRLSFEQIPSQLLGMARVSGVDHILSLA